MATYTTQTDRGPGDEDRDYTVKEKDEFLKQAVSRFNRAGMAESRNRAEAIDDLRFKSGDQWPQAIRAERTKDKRPCLTINKTKTFVHQITNDQRQNRPAINVSPVGDKSDPNTAKMLKGLIKQIERQSNADIAYDTAFENAVSNGWGYWRVYTEYASEDSFDQVIKIGRIRNPFRVYLDPDCQEPTGEDAKWGFISDKYTKPDFKMSFPNATEDYGKGWQEMGLGEAFEEWIDDSHIRVAEYFYCEYSKARLVALQNGHVGFWEDMDPGLKAQVEADPTQIVKDRDVYTKKICWDTITCKEILEHHEWAGKWIPIVRVVGDEIDVEGEVLFTGLIRDAKDPQRMYNFWRTMQTEFIALQPKAPWIVEEGQVEGHEEAWKQANTRNLPYLQYRGTSISGKPTAPPQRQPMPAIPAGIVQATMDAAQDMQAVSGIRFDATMQERMYDESGKALRELKRVGDLGNFHYVDNLSRSLRHTGRILIDLIPKIYDTQRTLTIIREDDTEENVQIVPDQPESYKKDKSGEKVTSLFNPNVGEFEVAVNIGPSFATKRAEAADSMINFLKVLPNTAPMVADLIAKNMDWPGAEEIYERLASQLPPNLTAKSLDDLPPQARAIINSLTTQLQKISQEHQQALAMLGDKEGDRVVDLEKIQKDYDAKVMKIAADMEIKLMGAMDQAVTEVKDAVDMLQGKITEEKYKREMSEQKMQYENKLQTEKMKGEEGKNGSSSMREGDFKNLSSSIEGLGKNQAQLIEAISRPRKRKGKIKGPSGKVYEIEASEE